MSVTIEDIIFSALYFVFLALLACFLGYRGYLCVRDPDRIRNLLAGHFLDTHISDAFLQERLFPRYRRLAVLLMTFGIATPLLWLHISFWWCPLVIGIAVSIIFELKTWHW